MQPNEIQVREFSLTRKSIQPWYLLETRLPVNSEGRVLSHRSVGGLL